MLGILNFGLRCKESNFRVQGFRVMFKAYMVSGLRLGIEMFGLALSFKDPFPTALDLYAAKRVT